MRPAGVKIARIVVFIIFLLSFLELCIFEMKGIRREVGKKQRNIEEWKEEMGKKPVKLIFCAGPDGAETCSDKR